MTSSDASSASLGGESKGSRPAYCPGGQAEGAGLSRVSVDLIRPLLGQPDRIRNVCILAHVDHGKTTLTDSLLASNGIISFKQAGRLRYLDSREDEQERGITMESSAISLLFDAPILQATSQHTTTLNNDDSSSSDKDPLVEKFKNMTLTRKRHLINLIDSPGHVDFASQVVTASRLCDGCLVLVDAVEGVCTQTAAVLRQAHRENLTPVLVINKLDRLIFELGLSTTDATSWCVKLLEQVNAIYATVRRADDEDEIVEAGQDTIKGPELVIHGDDNDEHEADISAQPNSGNKTSSPTTSFFDPVKGNVLFVSATDGWGFRLDHFADIYAQRLGISRSILHRALWGDYFYDAKRKRVLGKKTAEKYGLSKPMFAQFVLDNIWAVYEACLGSDVPMVERVEKICTSIKVKFPVREVKGRDWKAVLRNILCQWLPLAEASFAAIVDQLPSPVVANKKRIPRLFGPEVRQTLPDASIDLLDAISKSAGDFKDTPCVCYVSKLFSVTGMKSKNVGSNNDLIVDETLIGMARLFNGSLSVGQKIHVLQPKYNPTLPTLHHFEHTVGQLYILMGRELQPTDKVYMGNVFGIGGLEEVLKKSGTLSSTLDCPSFDRFKGEAAPIVRVAVQPSELRHLSNLVTGLRLLCQADPCAETYLQEENGEHILVAAGELHLEQCLKDLRERFTQGIAINVSLPMVPFRETIVAKRSRNDAFWKDSLREGETCTGEGSMLVRVPLGKCEIMVRASSMPRPMIDFITKHKGAIRQAINNFSEIPIEFQNDWAAMIAGLPEPWSMLTLSQIWAFGPRRIGPNLLVVPKSDQSNQSVYDPSREGYRQFRSSLLAGFQLAVEAGPLCGEPTVGIAYHLESIRVEDNLEASELAILSGQLISTMREACHRAFYYWSPRLMLAMYSCDIQSTAEVLGRVYSAISKRQGHILSEEYNDGTGFFTVKSLLPVIESFGFSDDIRGRTSGVAIPQLVFHGFEMYDEDPFWTPCTEEELEDFGETAERANLALKYLIGVRERKGLFVEKKLVQCAEKQRTLKR